MVIDGDDLDETDCVTGPTVGAPPPEATVRPGRSARIVPAMGIVTRVSLIEDELLLRRMLEQLLAGRDEVRLVHSVGGFAEARLAITPGSTDVVVVDVNLIDGNGIALAQQLQRDAPDLGVLILSSQDVMGLFMGAQARASKPWSYLSKRSSFTLTVLLRAIVGASRGEQVIDPYLVQQSVPRKDSKVEALTPAQFRVLALVAEGLSNEGVSAMLGVSVRSVENHLLAVYKGLGLSADGRNRRVAAALEFLAQTSRSALG